MRKANVIFNRGKHKNKRKLSNLFFIPSSLMNIILQKFTTINILTSCFISMLIVLKESEFIAIKFQKQFLSNTVALLYSVALLQSFYLLKNFEEYIAYFKIRYF